MYLKCCKIINNQSVYEADMHLFTLHFHNQLNELAEPTTLKNELDILESLQARQLKDGRRMRELINQMQIESKY